MKIKHLLFTPLLAVLLLASCSKETATPTSQAALNAGAHNLSATASTQAIVQTFAETFESGTKAAYASASVSFSSGPWTLDDALVGNTATDRKQVHNLSVSVTPAQWV